MLLAEIYGNSKAFVMSITFFYLFFYIHYLMLSTVQKFKKKPYVKKKGYSTGDRGQV